MDQKSVERVQRRVTKLVPDLSTLPCSQRIMKLGLPSLQYRRRRGDMIQVYKIVSGINGLDQTDLFAPCPTRSSSTRVHSWKLFKQGVSRDVRKYAFSQRVINDWNSLPENMVSSSSLNAFKISLDDHWVDHRFNTPFTVD